MTETAFHQQGGDRSFSHHHAPVDTEIKGAFLRLRYLKRLMLLPLMDFVFGLVSLSSYDDLQHIPFIAVTSLVGLALPLWIAGRIIYNPVARFVDNRGSFTEARTRLFSLHVTTTMTVFCINILYAGYKFIWDPLDAIGGAEHIILDAERWRIFASYVIFFPFLTYFLVSDCVARIPVDLLRRYNLDGLEGRGRFIGKIAVVVLICSILPLVGQMLELSAWNKEAGIPMGDGRLTSRALDEGISALLALILSTYVVLRSLDGPLRRLIVAVERVRDGDLNVRVPVSAVDDLGLLTSAFNNMVESLRFRDHMRFGAGTRPDTSLTLADSVSKELAMPDFQDGDVAASQLEMHSYQGAILIISLDEFDALSERLPADRAFHVIENFYGMVSESVLNRGGVIVDRMSNMVMAVFREEEDLGGHTGQAIEAFDDVRHLLRDQVFLIGLQLNVKGAVAAGDLLEASAETGLSQNFSADNILLLGDPMDRAMELIGLDNIPTDSLVVDESIDASERRQVRAAEEQKAVLNGYSGRADIHILTGEREQ